MNECEKNGQWRGDHVGYTALHEWIKNHLPRPRLCQICNLVPSYDLTNISGKYLRDINDWRYLCRRCHMLSDGRMKNLDNTGRQSWNKGKFMDMSNRYCSFCGSTKTLTRNNRPKWAYLNDRLVCWNCYNREGKRLGILVRTYNRKGTHHND